MSSKSNHMMLISTISVLFFTNKQNLTPTCTSNVLSYTGNIYSQD